jgi:hypothetical protein
MIKNPETPDPETMGWGVCRNCKVHWLTHEKKAMAVCHLRLPEGQFKSFSDHLVTDVNVGYVLRELNKISKGVMGVLLKRNEETHRHNIENVTGKRRLKSTIDLSVDGEHLEVLEYSMGACISWGDDIKTRWEFCESIYEQIQLSYGKDLYRMQDFIDAFEELTFVEPEEDDE